MDWIRNNWQALVANGAIAILAALFAGWLGNAAVHVFWGIVVFVFFWIGWFIARAHSGRCDWYDTTRRKCRFGIVNFHKEAIETDEDVLLKARNEYTWTGATGRQPVSFMNARDLLKRQHSTCTYSFAIMDPDLKTLVLSHDGWEQGEDEFPKTLLANGTPDTPRYLAGSCQILEEFAEKNPKRVQIHFHPMAPTFRVIVADDKRAYVSFYRQNSVGYRGFQLEIENNGEEKCIFEWFKQFHERHKWEAERNGVIRTVLGLAIKKLGEVTFSEIQEAVNTFRKSQRKPMLEDKVILDVCNEWGLRFS